VAVNSLTLVVVKLKYFLIKQLVLGLRLLLPSAPCPSSQNISSAAHLPWLLLLLLLLLPPPAVDCMKRHHQSLFAPDEAKNAAAALIIFIKSPTSQSAASFGTVPGKRENAGIRARNTNSTNSAVCSNGQLSYVVFAAAPSHFGNN
jgi:hypothetical protein